MTVSFTGRGEDGTPKLKRNGRFVQNALFPSRDWLAFAWLNAWSDTVRQYQRTILGPIWLIIGQAVYILGIAFIYSAIFKIDPKQLMPYLSSGIISWTFVSTALSTAPTVLVAQTAAIGSFQIPLSTFCLQNILRYAVILAHGLAIHSVVLFLYGPHLSPVFLLAIPGLFIAVLALYPMSIILSVLGARFRDIGPAIGSATYFLFLITPIIWRPQALGAGHQAIVLFNPVYHIMSVFRLPLIMETPSLVQYMAALGMAALLWVGAAVTLRTLGRKVVFWL